MGATASDKKIKAIIVDIGLMQNLCGMAVKAEYAQPDLLSIYRGALAEQFVGQELMAYLDNEVHFCARDMKSSSAEVDYLVALNDKVFPIEVKSGPAGKLKSLHMLLQTYPDCPVGIVLSGANFFRIPDQKLFFLPLYYVSGLAKNPEMIIP